MPVATLRTALDGRALAADALHVIARSTTEFPADLPGAEIVVPGLADLSAGRPTVEALVVAVGAGRLEQSGVLLPSPLPEHAKDRLWAVLEHDVGPDAHARYNALIGRLISFADALDSLTTAQREGSDPIAG